jgi:hypothetical protein
MERDPISIGNLYVKFDRLVKNCEDAKSIVEGD